MNEQVIVVMLRNSDRTVSGTEVFGPFENEDAANDWIDEMIQGFNSEQTDECNFSIQSLIDPTKVKPVDVGNHDRIDPDDLFGSMCPPSALH